MADSGRGANHRPTGVAALACGLALGIWGCDLRDEPVRGVTGGSLWPRAASRQPPRPEPSDQTTAAVAYEQDWDAARRRATVEGRCLLVVFNASWCRWSGELARGPLADPDVVRRTRRCVCTVVDPDRDPTTCRAFGVSAFPTVIVLDADGRELFRGTGAAEARGLAAALDRVPEGGAARDRLAAEGPPDTDRDVTR